FLPDGSQCRPAFSMIERTGLIMASVASRFCARVGWIVFVVGLLLLVPEAPGAAASAPELLADASALDTRLTARDAAVVRDRLPTINLGLLLQADGSPRVLAAGGTALQLNLFDDAGYTAMLETVAQTSPVGYAWSGRLAGVDHSSVVLVVERDVTSGQITTPGGIYQIRYVGGALHVVSEIDQSRLPREASPLVVEAGEIASAEPGAATDDGSQIDVIVLYTPAARLAAGGTAAMDAEVDLAIATTNTTYANSGITQRLRLMYKGEIAYTESGAIDTDLNRLTNPSDGFMDSAHTLRETYKADLVSLIVENG